MARNDQVRAELEELLQSPKYSDLTKQRIRDALDAAADRDRIENGGCSVSLEDWQRFTSDESGHVNEIGAENA